MNEKKLNVIVINDFANINGGAAKVAIDTAIGLSYQNVDVHYFCAVGMVDNSLLTAPLKSINHMEQQELLYADNKIKALLDGIWNKSAKDSLSQFLDKFDNRNTIVHVHGWIKSLSSSVLHVAVRKKFPVVISLHDFFIYCPNGGFYNFPQKKICHKTPLSISCILSHCDSRNYAFKLYRVIRNSVQRLVISSYKKHINLIALSRLSHEVLTPYIKDFKQTFFIENPIDTQLIPKVEVKNNRHCVFIGRLSPEKGVLYFCEALKLLGVTKAIVIGEGNERAELEKLYPFCKFLGWQSKDHIKEILKTSRFLVFPSIWYETYGLVVQEAASYGIPCIVSDCSAASELIANDENGLIFKGSDVLHLSQCIDNLIKDDERVSRLGETAYKRFWMKDHSISKYALQLKEAYVQMLNANYNS